MKVLIVGLGSIACRHIKNLKALNKNLCIAAWRQHSKEPIPKELKNTVEQVFFSRDDAIKWKPDVTFITNPATMHIQAASIFLKQDSHLFIEKPLSVNLDGIEKLSNECKRRKRLTMVGYVLRFSEPLQIIKKIIEQGRIGRVLSIKATVGQNLLNWRTDKRYQDSVSAQKKLGGGVLFELSHELDYVGWLNGVISEIYAQTTKVSDLEIDTEDIAEICLKFRNGAIGNIHLDMIDHAANRSCRIVGTKGTLFWETEKGNRVCFYSARLKKWIELRKSSKLDINKMYKTEIKHFFDCIKTNKKPLISLEEAKRVIEIILAAKLSADKKRVVKL
ncbi:MAG: Gfo/Idh/MocA family oxidoreductase [Candidatus Omnitrophica bacterium]|nr:Gfo/Idh/MocA family oxidoreductase [Candidatus Omnitrophota bacterium]